VGCALIGSGAFGRVHVARLSVPGGDAVTVAAKMLAGNHEDGFFKFPWISAINLWGWNPQNR
jgi:hypothetical protein